MCVCVCVCTCIHAACVLFDVWHTPLPRWVVLGDHLESIFRSLLSKLHSVVTFTVVQSLLMVLVYLVHTQLEATLAFLERIPDVSGQSSMVFVLREWTSRHSSFFGKWETRMSSLAMADLLSHYLATGWRQVPSCHRNS